MQIFALADGTWLNPPPSWDMDAGTLRMTTGDRTDFWRNTHYGFIRDSGHFLGLPVEGDFTATLSFEAAYRVLYDQAGLMLRLNETNWLKLGIEHSDGATNFSMVVTREDSDWSVVRRPLVTGQQTVRLTRQNGAVIAHFRDEKGQWQLLRVANFPGGPAQIGPMSCTPERSGLAVTFSDLTLGAPIENPLHA